MREDENDWFYAVQSNNALVKLADEGKITKNKNALLLIYNKLNLSFFWKRI